MKAKNWQVVHHTLTHARGVLLNKGKNIAYVLFDNEGDVKAIPLHQIVVITNG